jgi:hypothetical protein
MDRARRRDGKEPSNEAAERKQYQECVDRDVNHFRQKLQKPRLVARRRRRATRQAQPNPGRCEQEDEDARADVKIGQDDTARSGDFAAALCIPGGFHAAMSDILKCDHHDHSPVQPNLERRVSSYCFRHGAALRSFANASPVAVFRTVSRIRIKV